MGPNSPGKTVGPTFVVFRTVYMLPHWTSAWTLLEERLLELAEDAARIATPEAQVGLGAVENSLRGFAALLAKHFEGNNRGS